MGAIPHKPEEKTFRLLSVKMSNIEQGMSKGEVPP